MKIVFIIPTLDKGGAERVLVNLANYLDDNNHTPIIFCLKTKGELIGLVNKNIQIVDINQPRIYFSIPRIVKELQKVKPDIIVGWLGNVNSVMAFYKWMFPKKYVLACRESSIPSLFNKHYRIPFLFNFFYRFYNRFDGIVCQSKAMRADLIHNFHVKEEKISVIHNPIVIKNDKALLTDYISGFLDSTSKCLLFVGRFSREKQIPVLIDVLSLLPAEYKLILVGYGPLEEEIQNYIQQKKLQHRIVIVKNCSNPRVFYQKADCLLLTSDFEGFPNVVLEANSYGCPAVIYKTKGGAKEIIDSTNGIYIEPLDSAELDTFSQKIMDVCMDKERYNRKVISQKTLEVYGMPKVASQYIEYFQQLIDIRNSDNAKQ